MTILGEVRARLRAGRHVTDAELVGAAGRRLQDMDELVAELRAEIAEERTENAELVVAVAALRYKLSRTIGPPPHTAPSRPRSRGCG